ncbi:hypothetical protein I7I52_02796 [Histoplasma capsulatum]|uniref:Uncharacterized protein n=1 Tax=Ajellomyces capsulatus TaxID=5037 RepID=A0A8H8D820_AJECA|nr:hypothetical protein I7I52_02796 [Histoplasma capsulatum]
MTELTGIPISRYISELNAVPSVNYRGETGSYCLAGDPDRSTHHKIQPPFLLTESRYIGILLLGDKSTIWLTP